MLLSARGAWAPVAAEMAKSKRGRPPSKRGKRRRHGGGSGGTGAEVGAPPAMSRMDKIRADMNKKVARPAGDVDAPEL